MRLVHEPSPDARDDPNDGDAPPEPRTLASDVETADSFASRLFGLMFRSSVPDDYALVFPFDGAKRRGIHTAFVRVPIDVVWVADERVTRAETLAPWRSVARAEADTVIELAAGGANGVNPGDAVRIEN